MDVGLVPTNVHRGARATVRLSVIHDGRFDFDGGTGDAKILVCSHGGFNVDERHCVRLKC